MLNKVFCLCDSNKNFRINSDNFYLWISACLFFNLSFLTLTIITTPLSQDPLTQVRL